MDNLQKIRHSCAHLLAAAVLRLWPKTKLAIGPAIENGFYYDFDFDPSVNSGRGISEDDLPKIERTMAQILKTWHKFTKQEIRVEEARKKFKNNPYKLELIDELTEAGEALTTYKSGDFEDLCKGGHAHNPPKEIGAFKLLSVAGAYWRGSEKNPMLTRIYGICFPTKKELDEYLSQLEEAKRRDHRKLGPFLELFFFHKTAPGMPYWLPKGVIVYNELINFWRQEHQKRGYQEIISPLLNKKELYVTSGHYQHYWENMFVVKTEEKEIYGVKAMNCPNAMIIYQSKPRSYRDLPLRLADTDTLHRWERSGTLSGLLRVREFRQDDAHIFLKPDQIKEEYRQIFEIVQKFYSIFNIDYSFRLGTRPAKFMGDKKSWDLAEKALIEILEESGHLYTILAGDGAFYGPKIDILMKDSISRQWQMGTIQLDFQIPKKFNLKYTDSDGQQKTPVTIHRVIYGSLERFIAILIEHYAGALPVWLSPVQTVIVPISDKFTTYANHVKIILTASEPIRVEIDRRHETLPAKIRDATLQKIPYLAIVGAREAKTEKVAVRTREGKDLGPIDLVNFKKKIIAEIANKT